MARLSPARVGLLATICLSFFSLVNCTPVAATTVRPGQCIQDAIESARPGATIVVKAGTYDEQLTINKDHISLVGQNGAVLVPPEVPVPAAKQNICYGTAGPGTIAGICVAGKDVVLEVYTTEHQKVSTVGRRVKGVSIVGFEVRGFSGENIALYGAEDAFISKNKLVDGQVYGFLSAGSINTNVRGNTVSSTGLIETGFRFIALCSDNVSGATVWNNDIDGYAIALCIQTNGANIQHNHVTNSCYGAIVDPGVDDVIVRHNKIGPTNPDCVESSGPTSGIVILGGSNNQVQHNDIDGQTLGAAATLTNAGAGIAVIDIPGFDATGNQIVRNDATNNDIDIAVLSASTTNVFKKNTCATPAELCT